jgi:hypothetical protein
MKTVAKKETASATTQGDTRHLVVVVKNGLSATVTSTSLDGWLKKGWKRLDEPKAGV